MHGGLGLIWPAGLKHTATRDRWFERFTALEPGMSLQRISAQLQESYASVYRWADLFSYQFPDLRRLGRVAPDEWKRVNWQQRDAEIARDLGVSRERVRQVRADRGIGPSAHRALVLKFGKWAAANRERLHGLPVTVVLKTHGTDLSQQVARRILRAQSILPHDPAARWRDVDWRLPNRDIARIWGTSAKYVANIRARLQTGSANWDAKSSRIADNPQYQRALAQETLKSRALRKAHGRPAKQPAMA
ncbi:MAG TPA: hypothetical protein VG269_05185 [Tepidisphaeraceae bacterium]|jgi:hypothetical protein|nr:hypothetical protein [Tepidisphaeraceae bacterium]